MSLGNSRYWRRIEGNIENLDRATPRERESGLCISLCGKSRFSLFARLFATRAVDSRTSLRDYGRLRRDACIRARKCRSPEIQALMSVSARKNGLLRFSAFLNIPRYAALQLRRNVNDLYERFVNGSLSISPSFCH